MTIAQSIVTILAVVLGTMMTRFLPFLLFPEGKEAPPYITYLGRTLPYAVLGLLIVFCLKDAVFTQFHGLLEIAAIFCTVILHRWKRNTLLSIAAGTGLYMLLIQTLLQ